MTAAGIARRLVAAHGATRATAKVLARAASAAQQAKTARTQRALTRAGVRLTLWRTVARRIAQCAAS